MALETLGFPLWLRVNHFINRFCIFVLRRSGVSTNTRWAGCPGIGGTVPVRLDNAASAQFQLDVYDEIMDTLHLARNAGLHPESHAWQIQTALLEFLESRLAATMAA